MRLSTLILTLLLSIASTFAQLNGDGFYRIQNYESKRYVYVTDDKGEVNYNATTVDMSALQLWTGFEKASSDPSTICYIKKAGDLYDIQAQGSGIYEMVETYINLRERNGSYLAYATYKGFTKYLGDGEKAMELEKGAMSTETSGTWRQWNIIPVSLNDDAYFGIKPTVSLNGTYYNTLFASFPFTVAGSGMKVMYIYKLDNGMAVYKEITGTVPSDMPVIIQCPSDQPINNKLNIGGSASDIPGNLLNGVYFHNTSKKHNNLTPYNPDTMRMLGVMSNGKIGFIKADIENIPANSAYLSVPAGSPDEIKLVSEQEYNEAVAKIPTGISLSSSTLAMTEGDTSTLTATLTPATAETTLTWTSNNSSVATVVDGTVTAIGAGSATITVSTHNNLSASCTVTVSKPAPTGISLSSSTLAMTEGDTSTLKATLTPATAETTLTWSSNNTSVATVVDGTVTAVGAGSATITVSTHNNLSASCEVTVVKPIILAESITLDQELVEVEAPTAFTLTATVLPDNTSNKAVKWTSSNETVATVDNNGNVKVLAAGEATITATTTDATKLSASCKIIAVDPIVIAQSIALSQTSIDVKVPAEFTLSATVLPSNTTNKTVTWESSNTEVATVDENGKVNVIGYGEANITATTTDGSNLSASCHIVTAEEIIMATSITLDQTSVEVDIPSEFTLTATVLPENTSNKGVKWESSNTEVASVDNNGNVKVIAEGDATITASTTDGSNLSAVCSIKAIKPVVFAESISLNIESQKIIAPFEFTLIATVLPDNTTNKAVKWESDNMEVATVDEDGNVNVLTEGAVTITANTTDGTNLSAACVIEALSSIKDIFADTEAKDVYTITGIYIGKVSDPSQLSPGIYIINQQKVIIK